MSFGMNTTRNNPETPSRLRAIDWPLFFSTLPILALGLVTMYSFTGRSEFFGKQLVWIAVSFALFFIGSFIDWRFLRRSDVLFVLFLAGSAALILLFISGKTVRGAQSWFDFGPVSIQPVEPIKLLLILILAKYFSRRHIEIAHIRHILISAVYAGILFLLVLLQPDFGGAIVIFCIWLGMVLLSGISKKHLLAVFLIGLTSFMFLWTFVFKEYQKQRLITFIHPLTDVRGSGYNAYQSMIAVGSGGLFGKGVGLGSQSRLKFLPEYETDFMFAAFAEEWGFVGVVVLFGCYALLFWRILHNALHGRSNFEILYGLGLAIFIMSHFVIHVGMNLGLLPVTGITIPFMSYGGTHLATLYMGLGILMGQRAYSRAAHKETTQNEFLSITQ
ncbi:MAG: rod shape-determining protein RodA [bacterium]|nr:rod shape-determining protein RodA [bacterium]